MTMTLSARVVVSEHKTYGLQVRTEVQVPGTGLWLPIRATAFKNEGGELLSYLSVNGMSLKRFISTLKPEPSAARVDTADSAEESVI